MVKSLEDEENLGRPVSVQTPKMIENVWYYYKRPEIFPENDGKISEHQPRNVLDHSSREKQKFFVNLFHTL